MMITPSYRLLIYTDRQLLQILVIEHLPTTSHLLKYFGIETHLLNVSPKLKLVTVVIN